MKQEVRDLRHGFFIIDNVFFDEYMKVLSPIDVVVYMCLCRHAGKDSKAFPSYALIAKECNITRRCAIDSIKALQEWNIIGVNQTKSKNNSFKNNCYFLFKKEIWKKTDGKISPNILEGGSEPQFTRVVNTGSLGSEQNAPLTIHIEEDNLLKEIKPDGLAPISNPPELPFDSDEYIEEAYIRNKDPKKRFLPIIGGYFKIKEMKFPTKSAVGRETTRFMKTAIKLLDYNPSQINATVEWMMNQDFLKDNWTMETILKYIDNPIIYKDE